MLLAPLLITLVPNVPIAVLTPADSRVVYVGRFDRTQPGVAVCQWSASEVRLRVVGSTLIARIDEDGDDRIQVVVDGKSKQIVVPETGTADYSIALGSGERHDVSLIKRTEPFVGTVRFLGFQAPGGRFEPGLKRDRLIEFVGDSITCGYGIEGTSEKDHFKPETENAYESYASRTARALNADLRIIAWSGRKMWPDNTMPEIYDRILPTQPAPTVAKEQAPAAVVIHLATNDYQPNNPPEEAWTSAYEAFIRRIWSKYPKTRVVVTLGGMLRNDWPVGHNALDTARGALTRMVARMRDPRLSYLEYDIQKLSDGIGADWHPNLVTHRKMSARLTETLRTILGWN